MEIGIIVKLGFILAITVFVMMRKENSQIKYFPQQTWTYKEVLPVYWLFIVISLISLFLNKTLLERSHYIFSTCLITFLTGFILFSAVKIILGKRKVSSIKVIGAKKTDLYWLLILITIQYTILLIYLYSRNSSLNPGLVILNFGYFSITLVFWPVIESVLYLGMMFIPTSRVAGLMRGAILISLLQTLSHFQYNISEMAVNFTIFGLLGCYLYIKSKRIIVPLIIHSSINFLVLIRDINALIT